MTLAELDQDVVLESPDGKRFRLGPLRHGPNGICGARLIPIDTQHPLKATGDAHRDRLVAARCNLREGLHA